MSKANPHGIKVGQTVYVTPTQWSKGYTATVVRVGRKYFTAQRDERHRAVECELAPYYMGAWFPTEADYLAHHERDMAEQAFRRIMSWGPQLRLAKDAAAFEQAADLLGIGDEFRKRLADVRSEVKR